MTKCLPRPRLPVPWRSYTEEFDDLCISYAQGEGFRQYLEGLLLPAERNKAFTALANAEPLVGSHHGRTKSLQWFLSESRWNPHRINRWRLRSLLADLATTPGE
jgi:hypothetical protein